MKQILIGLYVLACLSACSYLHTKSNVVPAVSVTVEGQDRIRFEGKGSGAGFMLMSAMGPAGIAVGVAIDEGISKEIHETFSIKYRFAEIAREETERWLGDVCGLTEKPVFCNQTAVTVVVTHYGFKTSSGEDDPVVSNIKLSIDGRDYEASSDETKPLDLIKQNAEASAELLRVAFRSILAQVK